MGSTRREHVLRLIGPILAAALVAPLPQAALAQTRGPALAQPSALQSEIAKRAGKDLRAFYDARGNQPLWLNAFGRPSGAASMQLPLSRNEPYDGVDPGTLRFGRLAKRVERECPGATASL